MKKLTEKQKSYLAAMFDGEGHITLNSNMKSGSIGVAITPIVGVTNTNIALITHLHDITGIGIVRIQGNKVRGHKQKHVWNIRIEEMKELLPAIQSDLIIKWSQCEIVLEFLNRKWSRPLSEEDNDLRRIMQSEMTELNKRGEND